MAETDKPNQILFRFRPADSPNGVSRATMAQLADHLGFNETQVMHFALKRLAQEVLPAYERDEGPVSAATLKALKKREPQGRRKIVASSLIRT
jgi:hypothetical protein